MQLHPRQPASIAEGSPGRRQAILGRGTGARAIYLVFGWAASQKTSCWSSPSARESGEHGRRCDWRTVLLQQVWLQWRRVRGTCLVRTWGPGGRSAFGSAPAGRRRREGAAWCAARPQRRNKRPRAAIDVAVCNLCNRGISKAKSCDLEATPWAPTVSYTHLTLPTILLV